jgi:hypothetical protein
MRVLEMIDRTEMAREAGFKEARHLSASTLAQRYFAIRTDGPHPPNNS